MKRLKPRSRGKKVSAEVQRGMDAEKRFIKLARSLKDEVLWIKSVRATGYKHDQAGIDALVYIRDLAGLGHIKTPVQVKSSRAGVIAYREQHPECVAAGVVTVVVNVHRSDEHISETLKKQLEAVRLNKRDFTSFYEAIDARWFRSSRKGFSRVRAPSWKRVIKDRVLLDENLRELHLHLSGEVHE